MLERDSCVVAEDVYVDDSMLAPGYGRLNQPVRDAIQMTAHAEGILLDPTYTAKAMAGLIALVRQKTWASNQTVVFLHTGGTPALFGYPELVNNTSS